LNQLRAQVKALLNSIIELLKLLFNKRSFPQLVNPVVLGIVVKEPEGNLIFAVELFQQKKLSSICLL